ncbi:MAG TPA: hypothetical protein VIJ72_07680 [Rhizomicrobium sp.]
MCVLILAAPALLVWIVRGIAYAGKCAPGSDNCLGLPLGAAFHFALELSWALGDNVGLILFLSLVAAIGTMFLGRPFLAACWLLALPPLALLATMLAAQLSQYPGCNIGSESGRCLLWGADMGTALHSAGTVQDMIYAFAPYSIALALMLGLLGWFFTHPASAPPEKHNPFRFKDDH